MIKQFIAGSTPFTILPLYYLVNNMTKKNYSFYKYSIIAPIWLGFWNVIGYLIGKTFNLSPRYRFLTLTFITYFLSIILSHYLKSYKFTSLEWKKYYFYLFIIHFVMWNLIVYNIENLIWYGFIKYNLFVFNFGSTILL